LSRFAEGASSLIVVDRARLSRRARRTRSGLDPGLFHDQAIVHVEAAVRSVAADLFVMRVEPVLEHRNDRAALIVKHGLHLPDVRPALVFVGLAASLGEQLL